MSAGLVASPSAAVAAPASLLNPQGTFWLPDSRCGRRRERTPHGYTRRDHASRHPALPPTATAPDGTLLAVDGGGAAKALVLWEDAKKTGVVVSGVTVAYYFMEHSGSTLIALLCNLLMCATIASFLFTHVTNLLKW
jgi:hypothetical protein